MYVHVQQVTWIKYHFEKLQLVGSGKILSFLSISLQLNLDPNQGGSGSETLNILTNIAFCIA
jgi:hypothetical protein